jgi:putative peptidoglycan lipid II flippase
MLVLCAALNVQIIELLFERGLFTAETTVAVSHTLLAHLGVFAGLGMSAVAYNVFFAKKLTAPLIVVELGCLAALAGLGWLLMEWWGYVGIAVAGSVVAILRGVVALLIARRWLVTFEIRPVAKCLSAALMGAAATWAVVATLSSLANRASGIGTRPFALVMGLSVAGAAAYAAVLWQQQVPEFTRAIGALGARLRRVHP